MLNECELELLFDVLKKSHVSARALQASDIVDAVRNVQNELKFGASERDDGNIPLPTGHTVYKITDSFDLCYTYFLLSDNDDRAIFIGPYIESPISISRINEIAKENRLLPKQERRLKEYYASIPTVSDDSLLFVMINSFLERAWESPSFSIVDVNNEYTSPASPMTNMPKEENFDEMLADMKTMEKRYEYENELIRAVTLGQIHKESIFNSSFNDMMFEKRVPDLLRNAKNYCIIMNTLLRKAAEAGGVHPLYIDHVSSDFATKIENMPHLSETSWFMKNMFKTYCSLVRNHTMKNYSSLVQKTILLIDSDISAPLSPANIAVAQNVSLGYLSTVFKKETGKTLTGYIKDKRMAHARHLLSTTQLQIQTIALRCGIMDLQYFSKIFKKETGETPKQYRERHSS
ncbi:MAG: helix-turn-helix transcriptional regulator [Clostridia bacterium]|nr:helix-turn-helix transcriptional regulator [Clostridia bacterium]